MKIKMIAPGFETFTGHFGTVEFVDGVSVRDVNSAEAQLIAAIISTESIDDGTDPSDGARYQNSFDLPAVTVTYPTLDQIEGGVVVAQSPEPAKPVKFTKEQLEAIADAEGIAGIRKVADTFNIKGTSIVKLIEAILAVQTNAPEAAPLAEGQPDVVTSEHAE